MTVTITQLYKSFAKEVSEEAASQLTTYLEENKTEGLATKRDLLDAVKELRSDIRWFAGFTISIITIVITISTLVIAFIEH